MGKIDVSPMVQTAEDRYAHRHKETVDGELRAQRMNRSLLTSREENSVSSALAPTCRFRNPLTVTSSSRSATSPGHPKSENPRRSSFGERTWLKGKTGNPERREGESWRHSLHPDFAFHQLGLVDPHGRSSVLSGLQLPVLVSALVASPVCMSSLGFLVY